MLLDGLLAESDTVGKPGWYYSNDVVSGLVGPLGRHPWDAVAYSGVMGVTGVSWADGGARERAVGVEMSPRVVGLQFGE